MQDSLFVSVGGLQKQLGKEIDTKLLFFRRPGFLRIVFPSVSFFDQLLLLL